MVHFKNHTFTINTVGEHVIYENITNSLNNIYQLKINVKNNCNIIIKNYNIDFDDLTEEYELELDAGDTIIDESGYFLKHGDKMSISCTSQPITITYKILK